jgi:RNAse (barnase) inhibitor barstar
MDEPQNNKDGFFILLSIESLNKLNTDNCYIAWWDGLEATEWNGFYDMVSESLFLPEYFGRNLDALFDCLSDLTWLEAQNVLIVLEHFEYMLSNEIPEKPEVLSDLILLLSEVIDHHRQKQEFMSQNSKQKSIQICILSSSKAETILKNNQIPFQFI